jgi:hypothetical protein
VLCGKTRADLEEGLAIAFGQLVEDRAPGRIGEGLEDVAHPRGE